MQQNNHFGNTSNQQPGYTSPHGNFSLSANTSALGINTNTSGQTHTYSSGLQGNSPSLAPQTNTYSSGLQGNLGTQQTYSSSLQGGTGLNYQQSSPTSPGNQQFGQNNQQFGQNNQSFGQNNNQYGQNSNQYGQNSNQYGQQQGSQPLNVPSSSPELSKFIREKPHTQLIAGEEFTYSVLKKKQQTFFMTHERLLMLKGKDQLAYAREFPSNKPIPFNSLADVPAPKSSFPCNQIEKVDVADTKLTINFYGQTKTVWEFECPSKICAIEWAQKIDAARQAAGPYIPPPGQQGSPQNNNYSPNNNSPQNNNYGMGNEAARSVYDSPNKYQGINTGNGLSVNTGNGLGLNTGNGLGVNVGTTGLGGLNSSPQGLSGGLNNNVSRSPSKHTFDNRGISSNNNLTINNQQYSPQRGNSPQRSNNYAVHNFNNSSSNLPASSNLTVNTYSSGLNPGYDNLEKGSYSTRGNSSYSIGSQGSLGLNPYPQQQQGQPQQQYGQQPYGQQHRF